MAAGNWHPLIRAKVRRRYRPKTLILETEFETETGTATLIDFMPLRRRNPEIIRLVRCDRGTVRMRMDLVMRFDYGRTVPWVTRRGDGALLARAGPHLLVLRTNVPIRGEDLRTVSDFAVSKGGIATSGSWSRTPRGRSNKLSRPLKGLCYSNPLLHHCTPFFMGPYTSSGIED